MSTFRHYPFFFFSAILLIACVNSFICQSQTVTNDSVTVSRTKKTGTTVTKPKLKAIHPDIGEAIRFGDGKVTMKLAAKLQNYMGASNPPRDVDILSPKSVNIHPSGDKFYVNSLEGGKTIVYSLPDLKKISAISHRFSAGDSALWAPPSGLFKFRHYNKNLGSFVGKPVESAFSHNGRYLWVPYYRRSFDLNAQDPSALAVIDARTDRIIRVMEAGVLPKMIALSPDGKTMAVTHWGDNTVGLIDVSSSNPDNWKYFANVAIGKQLYHNFSLTEPVNRDSNTGEALRGTVFTPDGNYLLVGCMSGGGIAVIDVKEKKYLGKIRGLLPNVRHLVIKGNNLYASINASGYVQRHDMDGVRKAIGELKDKGDAILTRWQKCKVDGGARTLELSPKGDYIFVACNIGSTICVVDSTMKVVGRIQADSYPVGLDVSPDGKWLITTSQGRKDAEGGNCVDIFSLTGLETESQSHITALQTDSIADSSRLGETSTPQEADATYYSIKKWWDSHSFSMLISIVAVLLITLILFLNRRRKRN